MAGVLYPEEQPGILSQPATVNPILLRQIQAQRAANPRPNVTDLFGYGPDLNSYAANLSRNFAGQFEGLGTPQNFMGPFGFGGVTKLGGKTAHELAMEVAQKNAAKPVSEGGLGLPANNTAADRAKAMGFTTKGYRGSTVDEVKRKGAVWWSEHPDYSSAYAAAMTRPVPSDYAGNVMPLLVNLGKAEEFKRLGIGGVPEYGFKVGQGVDTGFRRLPDGSIIEGLTAPQNVRSRFAAFDPLNSDWDDLMR